MEQELYQNFLSLLRTELVPALGCTEPIALAYAAAVLRDTLGERPSRVTAKCSGNIVKNVMGVVVPNSGGQKGIAAAVALGVAGGDASRRLEVLSQVTPAQAEEARTLAEAGFCTVVLLEGESGLHILLEGEGPDGSTALVEILGDHTNIVRIERNGEPVLACDYARPTAEKDADLSFLDLDSILEFALQANPEDVAPLLERQIAYNTHIAAEGLSHPYGASVGRTLLASYGDDVKVRARAVAAAGSDARMSGCELPVVINSGSGNQGMTASLPVIEYAKELKVSRTKLYQALLISNLVAIHQKAGIGKLSAYCGAVSAACGAGVAITFLCGGTREQMDATIVNTLANVSGIVCDGAKPSCAAKIASALDAAIMAHNLAMADHSFQAGEGIVKDSAEDTIQSVGRLARDGMRQTDEELLHILVEE